MFTQKDRRSVFLDLIKNPSELRVLGTMVGSSLSRG